MNIHPYHQDNQRTTRKMFGDNPAIIQQERFQASSVPLFLVHDGGGTITSYYSFGDLGRDLYGIYNPRFQDGEKWSGGISEMAEEYVAMIKSIAPGNRIMLGGMLSLHKFPRQLSSIAH